MKTFHVTKADLHAHLEARMHQRGVTLEEIRQTMAEGWQAIDAKPGTYGKVRSGEASSTWRKILQADRG
jgi:hypothetical protein